MYQGLQSVLPEIPQDIFNDWLATHLKAEPTAQGVFRLVDVKRTDPAGFQSQRIIVSVMDENGFPIPNVKVAFAYSTANAYNTDSSFLWSPPTPRKAFIVPTQGGGQIDQIQGSAVKKGEPGGVSVFIIEPKFSSDIFEGAGMLGDHTGLHLFFQLQRAGVGSFWDAIRAIERRLTVIESAVTPLFNSGEK
jgi:hypothetical protein